MHFVPSLHRFLSLRDEASTPDPRPSPKDWVKGMSLLMGSGWKKMQVQHHVGLGVEADTHRAKPWTPSALHAAHSQAGGPFLKWTEWHISVFAMLITQDAMPHPVTGIV